MEAKAVEEKGGAQRKMNKDFTSKLNPLQVTDFVGLVPTLIAYLVAQTSCFKSGKLAQFIPAWQILKFFKWYQANILNSAPRLLRHILHQGNVLVGKNKLLLLLRFPTYLRKQ